MVNALGMVPQSSENTPVCLQLHHTFMLFDKHTITLHACQALLYKDSNLDRLIQSQACCRYTIEQWRLGCYLPVLTHCLTDTTIHLQEVLVKLHATKSWNACLAVIFKQRVHIGEGDECVTTLAIVRTPTIMQTEVGLVKVYVVPSCG